MSVATKRNAVAKRYKTNFIEPGIVSYESEGEGVLLVTKESLDKMANTFIGMPVFNEIHKDIDPELAYRFREAGESEKRDLADGIVADVMYNPESGWYDAVMLVWDEETIENIENKNYSVSCAYDIKEVDNTPGTWHNSPYDAKLIDGEYIHLAVVNNPRYEGAKIIKNSKPQEETVKITIFKKKKENAAPKVEPKKNMAPPAEDEGEVMENADGVVQLPDGTEVPLSELVQMYKDKMTAENEGGTVISPEDEIDIDGQKVSVADMINACGYGKQNAEPPQDETAEPVVDEKKQMQNSVDSEKGKKNMQTVKNAAAGGDFPQAPEYKTKDDRLAAGKLKYGKTVAGGK